MDRQEITAAQLKPVPRILRNLLARWGAYCVMCSPGGGGVNGERVVGGGGYGTVYLKVTDSLTLFF